MSKTIASYHSSGGRIAVEAMLSRRWYEQPSMREVVYPLVTLRYCETSGCAGIEVVFLWLGLFFSWRRGPGGGA